MPQIIRCPSCQAALRVRVEPPAGTAFQCPKCHGKFRYQPRRTDSVQARPAAVASRAPATRSRGVPWLLTGAVAVLILAGAVGIYLMTRPKGDRPDTPVANSTATDKGRPGSGDAAGSNARSGGAAGPSRKGPDSVVAAANPIDLARPTQLVGPSQDQAVNLAFSPDARKLAVFTRKGAVYLCDLDTRESVALAEADHRDYREPGQRLAFTADGKTLLAGNAFQVTAWNTADGQARHQFGQVPEGVRTREGEIEGIVAFSPDRSSLVTLDYPGDGSSRYQVWDTASFKERFAFSATNPQLPTAIRFSPDGKTLAATSQRGKLTRLWDVPSGKELDPIQEGYANIALVGGPPRLLGWQDDGVCVYYEWELGGGPARLKDRRTLPPETAPSLLAPVALTSDSRTLVFADVQNIRLWDIPGRKQRAAIRGGTSPFTLTPDGTAVLALASPTASPNKLVAVEVGTASGDLRTQHEFGVPRAEVQPPEPIAVSPDGRVLAVGAKDGVVHLRPLAGRGSTALKQVAAMTATPPADRRANEAVRKYPRKGPYVSARLKFSADGRFLVGQAVSTDSRFLGGEGEPNRMNFLWDVAAGKQVATLEYPAVAFWYNLNDFQKKSMGRRAVEVAQWASHFHSWTLVPGSTSLWVTADNLRWLRDEIPAKPTYTGYVAKGHRLVEFDLSGNDLPPLPPYDPLVRLALQMPADGNVPDGKIVVGAVRLQPFRDPWEPLVLEAAPDGSTVAGVVRTRRNAKEKPSYRLVLLNPRTLQEVASLAEFPEFGMNPQVAFSGDSKLLAATFARQRYGGTLNVRVWDVGTRAEKPTTATADGGLLGFADGRTLVTRQGPSAVVLYNTETGQKAAEYDLNRGHSSGMTAVAVSPSAPLLASGGQEGEVLLRDLASGDVLVRFVGHPAPISGVAFSADGKRLAATSAADLSVKVWVVPADLKPPAGGADGGAVQTVRLTPRQPTVAGGEPAPGATPPNPDEPVAPPAVAEVPADTPAKVQTNSLGMKLTLLPAGSFDMGAGESDSDAEANERPVHNVRITKPFAIGVHEVTVGQFRAFVRATRYVTEAEKDGVGGFGYDADARKWGGPQPQFTWKNTGAPQTDNHPVVNVSWNDAKAFCSWLSRKEGKSYRLPTEAEWEYACRAGTKTRFWTGDDIETLKGAENVGDASLRKAWDAADWVADWNDDHPFTAPVGSFKANPWGLFDMHGNAAEWTEDWFGGAFYQRSPEADPEGPPTGERRVLRGGNWYTGPTGARSAIRFDLGSPSDRNDGWGFRVVRAP